MNQFQAKHWDNRYKKITNCSKENPFIRKFKGGEKKFTDPEELLKYLEHSDEAAYMWKDAEGLAVIADMYQVNIKIITTKGEADENPTENWIYPEKEMEKYAVLKGISLGDLVLLHEENNHFNLIVSKDSDQAILGSLSYRFKVGPNVENKKEKEKERKDNTDEKFIDNFVELQKQFKLG